MRKLPEVIVNPYSVSLAELREKSVSYPSTSLFDATAQLREVTDLALEGHDPRTTFAYSSVGCSFGAELDSVAALLEAKGVRGADLHGLDIDPLTLQVAAKGQYVDPYNIPFVHGPRASKLRKLGFKAEVDFKDGLYIDSEDLRRQHTVNFHKVDLSVEPFDGHRQNLITCHNVLPHVAEDVDPQKAQAMATRMCSLLTKGGILSISCGLGWHDPKRELAENQEGITSYGEFHRRVIATMRMRYNMEVVLRDAAENVTALRKVR